MRNQWRALLRHHHNFNLASIPRISRPIFPNQVSSSSLPALTNPTFHRFYSSNQPTLSKLPETSLLIDIFSKPSNHDDLNAHLHSNNIILTTDLIVETIKHLTSQPDVAINFFNWVADKDPNKLLLDSNSYNLMLGILGCNGYVTQFWDTLDVMKKKGFGIKRAAFDSVLAKFDKDGLQADVDKLNGLFLKRETVEATSSRVTRIVRREAWDETVEKDLIALGLAYNCDLVKMVLEKLAVTPTKALLFFRWLEEAQLFKHDQLTYNTMAVVLGREDSVDRFWNVVADMRNAGFEMERKTYIKVLTRFLDRKMMEDVVRLYEFAMNGANKPSQLDCTFVLKKLAVAKEIDMELFSRVVKAFTEKGFALKDCMLDAVLKSLTSVGRMKECKNVLDIMVEGGFAPSDSMQARVAYDLSSSKMKDEAGEYMEKLEGHGFSPDYKTWSSLIEGHCVAGDFDKAKESLHKMVEKKGFSYVGFALDMLVNAYCDRYRGAEACKMLSDLVQKKSNFEPWHTTYKTLITKLLRQKGFEDALPLLGLMKKHGFPPYVDPFIVYLSQRGTPEEATHFFKAMTVKRYPSTKIYIRVFEAYSNSRRHEQAQDLLVKCPKHVRTNADVLNIFSCMKSEKRAEPKLASVAA